MPCGSCGQRYRSPAFTGLRMSKSFSVKAKGTSRGVIKAAKPKVSEETSEETPIPVDGEAGPSEEKVLNANE